MKSNIITVPNPLLKQKSEKIEKVDDELKKFIDDLIETMYESHGVGIAAVQVGKPVKLIIVVNDDDEQKYKNKEAHFVLINPEIIWKSDEAKLMAEGCLSVPECRAEVMRNLEVEVKYCDLNMKEHTIKADSDLAHRLQHEIDHTNGILLIDYLSKLKRDNMLKKVQKLEKLKKS